MQNSPTLVDPTHTLSTSYFQGGPKGKATRAQRHQQQQNEAMAKAAQLQKRYSASNLNTATANAGSKTAPLPSQFRPPKEMEESSEQRHDRLRSEAAAKVAAMKQQLSHQSAAAEQPLDETEQERQDRLRSEAAAKVAALKKQLDDDEGSTVGSKRNIIQERAAAHDTAPRVPVTRASIGLSSEGPTAPLSKSPNSRPSTVLPKAPPDSWQASLPEHQMDESDMAYLQKEGYPHGLIQGMIDLKSDFAKQIWIVDNSESMTTRDGTILADALPSGDRRFVRKASRWDELQECLTAHIRLAGALRQPTSFRLLNDPGTAVGPAQFGICESALSTAADIQGEVKKCLEIMARNSPSGQTPLTKHIQQITEEVSGMRAGLLASGKRVAIVICTDGLPTDASRTEFLTALRKLETLPVWLVIRLCTNEPHVVDFYNELDAEVKMSVDVIDDFQGEALDICKQNPWLNYGLPLHRARERGFHVRVLDFLDECQLSKPEQRELCGVIYGNERMEGCPEPGVDMPRFLVHIDGLQQKEQLQWDPIVGKMQPWFDFIGKPKPKLRKMGNMKRKKTTSSFLGCMGM